MSSYRVPYSSAESEFTEKKSRFISHIWPVNSEEEALACIKETKSKYYDARHNCYCYSVGTNLVRYSDDGEPQGTAGQPMLKVFERENIQNYCCVVTRYFGGILLGAGGLTRAYAKGAKDALSAAGAAEVESYSVIEINCAYPLLDLIRLETERIEGFFEVKEYSDALKIHSMILSLYKESFMEKITNISAGKASVREVDSIMRPGNRIAL